MLTIEEAWAEAEAADHTAENEVWKGLVHAGWKSPMFQPFEIPNRRERLPRWAWAMLGAVGATGTAAAVMVARFLS